MEISNLRKHLLDYWHWYIFTFFTFSTLFFLLHPGFYTFTDSGFFYTNIDQTKHVLTSKLGLFSNIDGFYFGYDNSARAFSELLSVSYQYLLTSIFGSVVGQIVFYFLYLFTSFFFGLKLLRLLFGILRPDQGKLEYAVRIGALFLAFNPVSLLLMGLMSVSSVYPGFIIFTYGSLKYFTSGRVRYLLIVLLSGTYLVSYLRLLPMLFSLAFFTALLFWRSDYFNVKRWAVLCFLLLSCLTPFFVNNIFAISTGSNIVSNYQAGFEQFESTNFNFKSSFLFSLSNPGGFTSSALSFLYNNRGNDIGLTGNLIT